jgi:hypothetical protein
MTEEKLLAVLAVYEAKLKDPHDPCNEYYDPQLQHLKGMIKEMRGFIAEGRREKVMRWLGFLQGVLWTHRVYTIDQLRGHNQA